MRKHIKLTIFIIICILLTRAVILPAQEYDEDERDFFSFKNYLFTYLYFSKIQQLGFSADGMAARRIKALSGYIVRGFDALREDRTDEAIFQFRRALGVLPEYFHLDFIIALAYENEGDFKNAARFYKSYLEKLKRFQDGMYPITKPMIEETVEFDILGYAEAKELIGRKMAEHGIDMEKVSHRRYPVLPMIIIFVVIAVGIVFLVTKIDLIKRAIYKTKARLNHSSEYWICTYCGKENANINFRCYNCEKGSKE